MFTIAAVLMMAGSLLAQDEEKAKTQVAVELSDAEAGTFGGYAADQVDANVAPEELESSLLGKIEELRKARGGAAEGKEPATKAKGKKKKKAEKKPAADTLKSGLTESDRQALGKAALMEINAGHRGGELADAIKKELTRLRAERVKASSTAETPKKKKKKKSEV